MVLRVVVFFYSNYATNMEIRNSVSVVFTKLGVTLLMCSSKTQMTITLNSMELECVSLSACAQEVKFVSMSLEEMTELQKPVVVCTDNQGALFLSKNRQVGICTKHKDIHQHF